MPNFLKSVARRIVDRRVLHLIRMWLDCPVEETDDQGRKTRTHRGAGHAARNTFPQGSPLSPVLANIYMRRFVLGWKMLRGLERSLGTRLRDLCRRPRDRSCAEGARPKRRIARQIAKAVAKTIIKARTLFLFRRHEMHLFQTLGYGRGGRERRQRQSARRLAEGRFGSRSTNQ